MRVLFGLAVCCAFLTANQPAAATCLVMDQQLGWINACSNPVQVRWTDEGSCKNWMCSTGVPARGRNTAYFKGMVSWCECNTPGCYPGQGPRCQ
jgi:hypothetical protein